MLVQRKHIAYTSSSYSSIHWEGNVGYPLECGGQYQPTWGFGDVSYWWKVGYQYTDLPVGAKIIIDGVTVVVGNGGSGYIEVAIGKPLVDSHTGTSSLDCSGVIPPCEDNSDCPEGEKCVDGECVPCDEQQATHFQIRFEYSELATDSSSSQSMYHLSDIIPISSSEGLVVEGREINQSTYYPRIRFCDSAGAIKPYTGTLSFYGFCTPDKSVALYSSNGSLTDASTFLGSESSTDAVTHNPWFIPRILINHIDPSAVIYESDCSSVTPEEPPDIEPVEPTQPDEPDEPDEPPDEPDEPFEPLPPIPPPQPQEGLCPCEEYIGLQIKRAADILYDGLILLKRELSVVGREIVVEMWEARKQQYQLSMFLQNKQFQLLQAQHQRLFEIRQILEKMSDDVSVGLVDDDGNGLIDIVSTGLVDQNDKGLVEHVKDFVEQYEPVTIENEYRTQSHRVIDNLDDVVNKL